MAAVRIAKRDATPDTDVWFVPIPNGMEFEKLELRRDNDRFSAMHTGGWTLAHPALVTPD